MEPKTSRVSMVARVATDCIAVRIRLINRVISSLYDEAMRPYGLRISQGNILVVVAQAGAMRPTEVCRRLRIDKSTLSRDVDLMKRQGWVESDPPAGGRNQLLQLTPRGLDLLEAIFPAWELAQAQARELIGEPGVAELNAIATRLGLG